MFMDDQNAHGDIISREDETLHSWSVLDQQ